jgi:hypothetical protein
MIYIDIYTLNYKTLLCNFNNSHYTYNNKIIIY